MSKLKLMLLCLVCLGVLGVAQEAPAEEAVAPQWVVWMDGTHYVPEWSYALEAVLTIMKPGEVGLLAVPGGQFRFVRQDDATQLQKMIEAIRPRFEQGANRLIQLKSEMITMVKAIEDGNRIEDNTRSLADIKAYLSSRNQLLNLYGSTQKVFWEALNQGAVPAGARLVVLVQQFDVPRVNRDTAERLSQGDMREWGIELQNMAPWEEKGKAVKQLAEKLKIQSTRVDGFYLKYKNRDSGSDSATSDRSMRNGVELSKALYSGVAKLVKVTGGAGGDLKTAPEEITEILK